jgi:hypothetical protein
MRDEHGESRTATYRSWASMMDRSYNPKNKYWHRYGGRGIRVAERWHRYINFVADMGHRPAWANGGLDRIDNDDDYRPGNCRWTTMQEQLRDRTKLSASDVRAIRADNRPNYQIAPDYGVSRVCIHKVKQYITHKEVA